jgi:hypothetical protein
MIQASKKEEKGQTTNKFADRNRQVLRGSLVQKHPARALWLFLEQAPQEGVFHVAKLATGTKRWT